MKIISKILLGFIVACAALFAIGWKIEGKVLDRQIKRNRAKYGYWR